MPSNPKQAASSFSGIWRTCSGGIKYHISQRATWVGFLCKFSSAVELHCQFPNSSPWTSLRYLYPVLLFLSCFFLLLLSSYLFYYFSFCLSSILHSHNSESTLLSPILSLYRPPRINHHYQDGLCNVPQNYFYNCYQFSNRNTPPVGY